MPRKTAAQRSRIEAKSSSPAIHPESAHPHQDRVSNETGQPSSKKVKIAHVSSASSEHSPEPVKNAQIIGVHPNGSSKSSRLPGHVRTPPPAPPKSIATDTAILPPEADDVKVRSQCDIHRLGIGANSKMEDKIRQVLQILKKPPDNGKPTIVALTSANKAANKCISVAEIAKREFVKTSESKVYQYTGCWTRLEAHEARQHGAPLNEVTIQDDDEDHGDSDGSFEDVVRDDRKKVRNAVCLTIYLSSRPIPRLKELYGEQLHESGNKLNGHQTGTIS